MSGKRASRERPPDEPEEDPLTSKRLRSAIDESIEEFMCPITHSLPLDPSRNSLRAGTTLSLARALNY